MKKRQGKLKVKKAPFRLPSTSKKRVLKLPIGDLELAHRSYYFRLEIYIYEKRSSLILSKSSFPYWSPYKSTWSDVQ